MSGTLEAIRRNYRLATGLDQPEDYIPEPEPPATEVYSDLWTVAEVKAWVGDDPERAAEALEQELERTSPRITLADWLTHLSTSEGA